MAPLLVGRRLELPWLNRERLAFYPAALFLLYLVFAALWTALTLAHGMMDPVGIPFGHVFIEFWTAAKAALGPTPAAIYDFPSFYAMQQTVVASVRPLYPWHYPPVLLLFLAPFALVPYLWAVPLWYGANLAGYLTLVKRVALERRLVWIGLAFPGTVLTLHIGQFGLLLVAALGWGLLLLEERPVMAGAAIAVLAVKPHLCLLVPLALLVARRWTVFATATLVLILLIAASWLAFGGATWRALLGNLSAFGGAHLLLPPPTGRAAEVEGFLLWNWQPSVFVMVRQLGLASAPAYLVQTAAALAAAAVVAWAWCRPAPRTFQASVLVTANLLVSPYVYNYDLVLLILPIAWLGWHGARHGWLPGEKLMILLAWLLPGLIVPLADVLGMQAGPLPVAAFLGIICRRIAHDLNLARHAETLAVEGVGAGG
jgi:hypothetical protein